MSFGEVQIENIRQLIADLKSECELERSQNVIYSGKPASFLTALAAYRIWEKERLIERLERAISR